MVLIKCLLCSTLHVNKTIQSSSEDFWEEESVKNQPGVASWLEWQLFRSDSLVVPGKACCVEARERRSIIPYVLGSVTFLDNYFIPSLMLAASTWVCRAKWPRPLQGAKYFPWCTISFWNRKSHSVEEIPNWLFILHANSWGSYKQLESSDYSHVLLTTICLLITLEIHVLEYTWYYSELDSQLGNDSLHAPLHTPDTACVLRPSCPVNHPTARGYFIFYSGGWVHSASSFANLLPPLWFSIA